MFSVFQSFSVDLVLQGLLAVIVIGVFYNLYTTTKVYGGIVGKAIRFFGLGMLFVVIAVLEKTLVTLGVLEPTLKLAFLQDVLNLLGLFFLGLGFSRLASAAKV